MKNRLGKSIQQKLITIVFLAVFTGMLLGCATSNKDVSQHDLIMEALSVYESALELEYEKEYEKAAMAYEQSIAISPRPIAHFRLGLVLAEQGKYEQALSNLGRAQELVPSLTIAQRAKERVEARMAMKGEVEGDLFHESRPARAPAPLIHESDISEQTPSEEKKPETQEVEFTEQPPVSSPMVELTLAKGYELVKEGDLDGAAGLYNDALMTSPDESRLYYNLGNIYQRQEKFKRAYIKYQRAIELYPGYARAWNNLGYVLERLSRSDEALECYEQAISSGQLTEAYYNSALLLEKKGKLEPALNRFREFIEKAPSGEFADTARNHIKQLERQF